MSQTTDESESETIVLFEHIEKDSIEDPRSEWSSLLIEKPEENQKRLLHAKGLYSPSSGEVCGKYIALSDSDVIRHCHYNYPVVVDPGIEDALFNPEKPPVYPADGQARYLALCAEMNQCPIGIFYNGLLTDEIDLSYYGVHVMGVQAMTKALAYNTNVKHLSLAHNFLDDDSCFHLGALLNINWTITELNLAGCRIQPSGVRNLVAGLPANRTLVKLDLTENELGEKGGEIFAELIFQGSPISQINLSKNKLGDHAAQTLAEAIYVTNNLTHLNLSWNFLNTPNTIKILNELSNNSVLNELNLSWNSLEGVRIAKAIQNLIKVAPLTILDLSNNRFCNDAIPLLVSQLNKCKTLVTLDLSYNPLTTVDANIVIEKMLQSTVKVQNVLMKNVYVDKAFVKTVEKVREMDSRDNFIIVHDRVLHNYDIKGPDMRELLMKRAAYLSRSNKKHRCDIAVVFLQLRKEHPTPFITVSELLQYFKRRGVASNGDLVAELGETFPGSKGKQPTLDLTAVVDFVQRLWPETKLPPTPPPEPETTPESSTKKKKETTLQKSGKKEKRKKKIKR